ncbi:S41 family peptidase [Mucilaginibacter pallidiroseus]|uniref:S41 family peptidase n=1 Tax=Mucilaginibacter pallidiroseus TaxID=2599295 RepID=A0A563TXF4_9SPHI|nr:S41 family peptidase [Mucilaginibacter pallidiroseus]TWR24048.1 S41 family peptidase [Mucilaginibacter pallidiroseus]
MKHTAGVILRTVVLILIGIAIGLFVGNENFPSHPLRFNFAGGSDKISKVLNLVNNKYVDSVNTDSIEGVTVNDMLQSLDPHSVYLPAQQAQNINERLEGGFTGIGLEYQLLRDTVVITQVYPGGPAAKAGISTGDRVITVDSAAFSGTKLTVARISKAFRGEKDTRVVLGIAKYAKGPVKAYTITRGRVALSSLDAAYMADAKTGYIKISKFASTTDSDFRAALVNLRVDGMEKLILDLRGNGGGYLNTATALADEFLPKDKLIVYTLGVHEPRTDYFATDSGSYENGPLTVLIDEYSASASEILAGAMQDLDRATIVGRRSFGKGLVQQQFPFGDGTAVNLTVARYYTPSGRSIQKSYSKGIASYRNELAERVRKGELLSAGSNLSDSAFLNGTAFHTQKGRKVFSRGGIMPDVFVPADTSQNTQLVYELNSNQLFTAYVIDKLQPELKNYPTADAFISNYQVTENELHHFVMYAAQTLKFMDSHELLVSGNIIKSLIKANAARFKWGSNAYYQVLNHTDNTVKVALKQ